MIDCKECVEYAHMIHAKGDITVEEINKLAVDRHVLKGCGVISSIPTMCFSDAINIPMDIVCNGFSIKKTIIDVLNNYPPEQYIGDCIEDLAEDIKEAFAIKMRLKQGDI